MSQREGRLKEVSEENEVSPPNYSKSKYEETRDCVDEDDETRRINERINETEQQKRSRTTTTTKQNKNKSEAE